MEVYDRQPHTQMTLLSSMDVAYEGITVDACRGWIIQDSFQVALQGKISGVMWMRICRPTDRNVWMSRDRSRNVLHVKFCLSGVSYVYLLKKKFYLCVPCLFLTVNNLVFHSYSNTSKSCEKLNPVQFLSNNNPHTVICKLVLLKLIYSM